jgi:O6-methylguanine-DNA--protein-cysteine methyltransferase
MSSSLRASAVYASICWATVPANWRVLCETVFQEPISWTAATSLSGSSQKCSEPSNRGIGVGFAAGPLRHRFPAKRLAGLLEIPAGETASYTDIANRIGSPGSAKEVAKACVRKRGGGSHSLSSGNEKERCAAGYRWGIHRKRALLT